MVAIIVPLVWSLFHLLASAAVLNCRQSKPCTAATFSAVLPAGATVEKVASVANGGSYGEGAANLGYPTNAQKLPAVCAVTIKVVSGTSKYRFGLFLPTAANWNSKFLAVGGYSQAGGINWPDMGQGPHYGMATVSTDTGHNSVGSDLNWATPDTLLDWGYRALNGSVFLGKTLTEAYYGKKITYSYWSGCSTGGRQGLKEIQISPESFDGALIGSAAWNTNHLFPWITKMATYNLPTSDPKHIDVPQFTLLAQTVQSQCDSQDGQTDNIVSSPDTCKIDLTAIQCGDPRADPSNCLTAPQIQTAKNIYSDYVTSSGKFVHNGFSPSSEAQWSTFLSFGAPEDFDVRYERFWLYNDPNWNWTQYTDSVVDDSERINPGQATADKYDISAFKKRGGKVFMYHGLADGVVPTKSSGLYYNRTMAAMGTSSLQDFFRLFYVPGMAHCWFTQPEVNAPWAFGGAGQATQLLQQAGFGAGWSTPGFLGNAKYDALVALMNWVEKGTAVDSVVATTWSSNGAVARQRPLCPWPKKAVYKGTGNKNDAASWNCA
ncbi:Tannase/feruloyl esterase [Coniochaeta sp. 2T2.1]|nr:Tannase/feruloyl esterase [Coniochaeta sp. 2T2.1]